MSAKPLQDETNKILSYIRKKTQGTNNWVIITSRDIQRLFNISQLYFTRLIEPIKEYPNILYEIDEKARSRYKPYKFRWTYNPREKFDQELTKKQFYWLTDEEIVYTKETTQIDDYAELSKIIKICNLLAGDKAKEYWISINIEELSDLTVATIDRTEERINLLIGKKILVKSKHNSYYRLVLDPSLLQNIVIESQQETLELKPKIKRNKQKPVELKPKIKHNNPEPVLKLKIGDTKQENTNYYYVEFRAEPELKADVENILNQLGINITDAIYMFLKQIVLKDGLPFEIKLPQQEPPASSSEQGFIRGASYYGKT